MNSDWTADKPGLCRQILPADLPPPSESYTNKARVVPRPHSIRELKPLVPPGFTVSKFFESDVQPRLIRAAPNGDIFVADSRSGQIRILRPGGGCTLGTVSVFARHLYLPFGIAFYPPGPNPQYVYVAENNRVVRFPYMNGMLAATGEPEVVVPNLPQGAGRLPGPGSLDPRRGLLAGRGRHVRLGGIVLECPDRGRRRNQSRGDFASIPTAPSGA